MLFTALKVLKQIKKGSALAPNIGYDKAASIAKKAYKNGTTLKHEVIKSGLIKEKDYNKIMDPLKMTKPK